MTTNRPPFDHQSAHFWKIRQLCAFKMVEKRDGEHFTIRQQSVNGFHTK